MGSEHLGLITVPLAAPTSHERYYASAFQNFRHLLHAFSNSSIHLCTVGILSIPKS